MINQEVLNLFGELAETREHLSMLNDTMKRNVDSMDVNKILEFTDNTNEFLRYQEKLILIHTDIFKSVNNDNSLRALYSKLYDALENEDYDKCVELKKEIEIVVNLTL